MKPIELLPEDIRAAVREMGTFVDCSETDLMRIYRLAQEHSRRRVIEDIPAAKAMEREVVSVQLTASPAEVQALLVRHPFSGMPVVDDAGRVVGVVSEKDFLFKLEDQAFLTLKGRAKHLFGGQTKADRKAHAKTLDGIMSTPPITVTGEASLRQVATLLLERDITRGPVVDPDGKLIGIISQTDLLRVLHHHEEAV